MASASALRASIDNSVDLPTPDPAKMPMRCPRQRGAKTSIVRTPVSIFPPTRLRAKAGGGVAHRLRAGPGESGPLPSSGRPAASTTRPSQADEGRTAPPSGREDTRLRSEEHTSELQSLMRISYAVFCLKKKTQQD